MFCQRASLGTTVGPSSSIPRFSPGPTFVKVKVQKDKHSFIVHLKDPKKLVRKGNKAEGDAPEDETEERAGEQTLEMGEQQLLCGHGVRVSPSACTHFPQCNVYTHCMYRNPSAGGGLLGFVPSGHPALDSSCHTESTSPPTFM